MEVFSRDYGCHMPNVFYFYKVSEEESGFFLHNLIVAFQKLKLTAVSGMGIYCLLACPLYI